MRGIPWDEVFGNIDDVCGEGYEEGGRIRPGGYDGWKDDYGEFARALSRFGFRWVVRLIRLRGILGHSSGYGNRQFLPNEGYAHGPRRQVRT